MKKRHKKSALKLVGMLFLAGISLKSLSHEFSIPYRTLKYHAQTTGFYIKDFNRIREKRGAIVIDNATLVRVTRRVQLINQRLVTCYIQE